MKFNSALFDFLDEIKAFLRAIKYRNELVWVIEPTSLCNSKCIFCTYHMKKSTNNVTVPLKSVERFMVMARNAGVNKISFTPLTGDVLNDPDVFKKTRLARRYVKDIYFYTNGIALKRFSMDEVFNSGVTDLSISIGGFDRESFMEGFGVDAFDVVKENVESLIDYKVRNNHALNISIAVRQLRKYPESKWYREKVKGWIKSGIISPVQVLTRFDSIGGQIKNPLVSVRREPFLKGLRRFFPCKNTGCVALLPDSTLRLCNCIASDAYGAKKDDYMIGRLQDFNNEKLRVHIEEVRRKWKKGGFPCRCANCTLYQPDFSVRI